MTSTTDTTVGDTTHVISGDFSVAAADMRQSEGAEAVCVASPSTPHANSEATVDRRLGVNLADIIQ